MKTEKRETAEIKVSSIHLDTYRENIAFKLGFLGRISLL